MHLENARTIEYQWFFDFPTTPHYHFPYTITYREYIGINIGKERRKR